MDVQMPEMDGFETTAAIRARENATGSHLPIIAMTESRFVLENDPSLIAPLVGYFEAGLTRVGLCDETGLLRVAVALREAVVNAMEHGNLELSSELREDDGRSYQELVQSRRYQEPYRDRRVHVIARESRDEAAYVVRDEGLGFDPSILPDPTDLANLEKVSGRGLLLIRTFMDHVHHNDHGREITMFKRREPEPETASGRP